jgi:RNA polymerase sigma-70 factor (sigma-E family)
MLTTKVERQATMDHTRIGELYARHADAAVRLAYLLTGDRALAEDLAQDAFVRLAGRLVHLRDPGAFDAYLRTTIVNLSHSHFRRKKVERAYLDRVRSAPAPVGTDATGRYEERQELWDALGRLSRRQRAAIVLRFYEDLPETEVAQVLGCAPGTVKSLVSRGLERLRTEIRGDE